MNSSEEGAGLTDRRPSGNAIGDSLDWFIGSWSEERARELEEAVADFEAIDEDMWR